MKKHLLKIGSFLLIIGVLTGCGGIIGDQDDAGQPVVPEKKAPLQMALTTTDQTKRFKDVGCGDMLTLYKISDDQGSVQAAVTALLATKDPATTIGAGYGTATALAQGYFSLTSVGTQNLNGVDTVVVDLAHVPGTGITGTCDVPRVKNQIIETIRANIGVSPFIIKLDGTQQNWDCFGNESGQC